MQKLFAVIAFLMLVITPCFLQAEDPISFTKQIAPIFVKNCLACHDMKEGKGDFRLDQFSALMTAGESGLDSIVASKPAESYLLDLLKEEDDDVAMPKNTKRLSAAEIGLIETWIKQGAKYDSKDPESLLRNIIPRIPFPKAPEAYPVSVPITALSFSPDGKTLAVGAYHEILIYQPEDASIVKRITDVAERTYGLSYSPDGKWLAAASGTPGEVGEVKIFDVNSGKVVKLLSVTSDVAFDVKFSPDGKKILCAGADRIIRIYDANSGKELKKIEEHADWVVGVTWSHDGKSFASASRDKSVKVFDAEKGRSKITYSEHKSPAYSVAFNQDNSHLISVGADKLVHEWKIEEGKKLHQISGFAGEVFKTIFSDGMIFGCASDKTVRVFTEKDRKSKHILKGHTDHVFSLSYDPAHKRIASGSFDGNVRLWNLEDGKEILSFIAAPGLKAPAAK
jgi:WD40 repeat protein